MEANALALVGLALVLGLRHGIDWDHIAAILDITSTQTETSRGFFLGTVYAVGHGLVVASFGLIALLVGTVLATWVDVVFERLVGATLLFLGVWVFYSLLRYRGDFRLRSRWMLVFAVGRYLYDWLRAKVTKSEVRRPALRAQSYGVRTAFGIGVIHSIGAETATQLLLFVSVAGAGATALGAVMIGAFVLGLILSNSAITVSSSLGFWGGKAHPRLYVATGAVTGVFSLVVGTLFLLGRGTLLPAILGG